ncbi:MAG: hypothetical protein LBN04_03805 [Oscillospiraceae bacterium]|jgi:hypothetical protein|nr:hypothetical protein [Oscillospiraceae bacterium]
MMRTRLLSLLLLLALLPLCPADADALSAPFFVSGGNLYEQTAAGTPVLRYIAPYVPDAATGGYRKAAIDAVQPQPGGALLIEVAGERILVDKAPLNQTLRVFRGGNYSVDALVAAYQAANPHLELQIIRPWEDPIPSDIYPVTSEGPMAMRDIRRARNMLPLDASPAIAAAHAAYAPLAQEALAYESGIPFAVPTRMRIHPWYVDWEMWRALGWDEDDLPKTADDLFTLLQIWNDQFAAQYPDRVLLGDDGFGDFKASLLHLLTYQALFEMDDGTAPLNFDTPAYRALIDQVAALPDGLPTARIDQKPPILWSLQYGLNPGDPRDAAYRPFLPPDMGMGSGIRIGAMLYGIAIPENAPNQPLALDFLAYAATHPDAEQADLAALLMPDAAADGAFAPYLTFRTNALGGSEAAVELASEMSIALEPTLQMPRPATWPERKENLIAWLNAAARGWFERTYEEASWYKWTPRE